MANEFKRLATRIAFSLHYAQTIRHARWCFVVLPLLKSVDRVHSNASNHALINDLKVIENW